ncbi:MAG: caspase family protein [Alphaproteobacteria bacterium]
MPFLRRIVLCAALAGMLVIAPGGSGAHAQDAAGNADDLLVVDCLLPGKVRRLGTRVTYVSERKAVKTTASECAIRGGEYTQADRASYTTALKIWLPLANEGDPVAQTYVGEIYEKGLGVEPQHSIAAEWYAKAAEKDFVRALLSLGALYEEGRGVPQDKEKAVELYRRASGLGSADVPFVPSEVKQELASLRAEKQQLEAERDALRRELDAIRRNLQDAQAKLRDGEARARDAQKALQATRDELMREVTAGRQDRILEITESMTERSRELERSESEVSRLKQQLSSLQQKATTLQASMGAALQDSEARVAQYKAEADSARAALTESREQLASAEKSLREQQRRMAAQNSEVAQLKQQLAATGDRSRTSANREKELADQLAAQEAALESERARVETLRTDLAAVQGAATALKAESEKRAAAEARLRKLKERAARAEQALREQRKVTGTNRDEIEALRAALNAERESASGDRAREAELARELAGREAALQAERDRIAMLSAEVDTLTTDAAALRQEADRRAEAEAKLKESSARLAAVEQALAEEEKRRAGRGLQVATLRKNLATERAAREREKAKQQELRQRLDSREAELARERERVAQLSANVSSLKDRADALQQAADRQAAAEAKQLAAGPVIEMIDPPLPETRTAGLPTITAEAGDERLIIGRVRGAGGIMALLVNDAEHKPDDAGLFRISVPLSDEKTTVRVVAVDANGKRSTESFMLLRKAVAARSAVGAVAPLSVAADVNFGRFHALVIGNNDYRMLPQLKTAVGDAQAVAALLKQRYGYDVTLLVNADRYAILAALNRIREDLSEDDNLLIYYAGHGELDRVNNRGHWLPVDAEPTSTANWISNIQITDVLNAMAVRQILVVADSCYSGTLTRASLARIDAGMSDVARQNWIRLMAQKRARLVLSSGGVQPVLDSGGGKHSVFASAFLGALEANTGIVEGQRLYRMVSERVTNIAAAKDFEQVPQYSPIKYAGHEAGDFFFVPTVN